MTTLSCCLAGHLHKNPSSTFMATSSWDVSEGCHSYLCEIHLTKSKSQEQLTMVFFGHTTHTLFAFSSTQRESSFITRLCDPSRRHLQTSELAYACYTVHRWIYLSSAHISTQHTNRASRILKAFHLWFVKGFHFWNSFQHLEQLQRVICIPSLKKNPNKTTKNHKHQNHKTTTKKSPKLKKTLKCLIKMFFCAFHQLFPLSTHIWLYALTLKGCINSTV